MAQNKSTFSKADVYTTAKGEKETMYKGDGLIFKKLPQNLETVPAIYINPEKTFQTFIGIGGAITDASAEVFATMPKDQQQELLNAYYNKLVRNLDRWTNAF